MNKIRTFNFFLLVVVLAGLFSCTGNQSQTNKELAETIDTINAFPLLMRHLERENDYINTQAPSVILASDVFAGLRKNNHIIDIRDQEVYAKGHIKGAVNISHSKVLDYLLNDIIPAKIDKIILVCENGDYSTYISSVLRLIGYKNVFALKFGMSSWHRDFAKDYWLAAIEQDFSSKLNTDSVGMPAPGEYPYMPRCETTCTEAMEEMASEMLAVAHENLKVSMEDLFAKPDKYFVICYMPKDVYDSGHFPGSICYAPRVSLRRDSVLNTLPLDKTIVPYCFSGHHTAALTAYLNLIGYTAKNLEYGSMGFMNKQLKANGVKYFKTSQVENYPYVIGKQE
jgi:rhodanese-related sulfurtransferase